MLCLWTLCNDEGGRGSKQFLNTMMFLSRPCVDHGGRGGHGKYEEAVRYDVKILGG